MKTSRNFSNVASEVGGVRRFVFETFAGADEEAVEDLCLMVSEISTNCVRYTSTSFVVRIDHTGRSVRVEVADGGGGEAVLRPLQFTEPGGRGLRIVQILADDWGVVLSADAAGKTVWFNLALPNPSKSLGSVEV